MHFNISKIFLIGAGNVGTHLALNLSKHVDIVGVYSKSQNSAIELSENLSIPFYSSLDEIPSCDLVLICTSDSSIKEVVASIPKNINCAYTSGSVTLEEFSSKINIGVFYPLQSFSKGRELSLLDVPFFVESENKELEKALYSLASLLSNSVKVANSTDRKNLHVGAVIVNNFTNHLGLIAKDFIENKGLDWSDLKPLLLETVHKMIDISPRDAQTGPARRNDQVIINEHLKLLSGNQKEIYQLMSKSIIETYHSNDKL